jgi:hypothetical protein
MYNIKDEFQTIPTNFQFTETKLLAVFILLVMSWFYQISDKEPLKAFYADQMNQQLFFLFVDDN